MAEYNLSIILDVSNPLDVLGVFNFYSFGFFTIAIIVALVLVTGMWLSREQFSFAKAGLISLVSFMIPVILFRTVDKLGAPLIPDWFVALYLVLTAVLALLVWNEKTN